MRIQSMVLLLAMAGLMGCTDIVDKGPNRIAIAVPSAYKLDNARLRADRYCERQSGTHATLVRTDGVGHDGVAYFRCES